VREAVEKHDVIAILLNQQTRQILKEKPDHVLARQPADGGRRGDLDCVAGYVGRCLAQSLAYLVEALVILLRRKRLRPVDLFSKIAFYLPDYTTFEF
jgi:hypothetical protein